MVVKTETCAFSGLRIYPGHGSRFVRADSKLFIFLNAKTTRSFHMRRNPRKLNWTLLYRRQHKKGNEEVQLKKKTRRVVKQQRAIVGASLDVIKAKRNQKPEVRAAARDAALREVKERQKAKQATKPKGNKSAAPKAKAPKAAGGKPKGGKR